MTAHWPSRTDASQTAVWRYRTLPPLRWAEFDRFICENVAAASLIWPDLPARGLVMFHEKRPLFDFAAAEDEGAVWSFVFLGYNEIGEAADLVAWSPRERRLAAWFGAIALLGEENLWAPRLGDPLFVYESPLAWLRAGRDGVVILDPLRAVPLLRIAEPLAAESVEGGQRLEKLLTVRRPRILVPQPELTSAA